ncbi:MAG: AtpZ/AtpI family protein [Alphaproteobacteria bacterium]|nr:AtpZ/AtpI family protein [Alphaproteobacteria bacterium]
MENTNLGVRVGTELAAAIIVGGVLGYALDIWLGTEPILFMGLLFLGIITGFVNVYRVVYGMRPLGDPARLRLRSDVTASRRDDDDKNSPDQE